MSSREKRALKIEANSYVLISRILFKSDFDGVLLRCLRAERTHEILKEMHEGAYGWHFSPQFLHIAFLEIVIIGQLFLKTHMPLLESSLNWIDSFTPTILLLKYHWSF